MCYLAKYLALTTLLASVAESLAFKTRCLGYLTGWPHMDEKGLKAYEHPQRTGSWRTLGLPACIYQISLSASKVSLNRSWAERNVTEYGIQKSALKSVLQSLFLHDKLTKWMCCFSLQV